MQEHRSGEIVSSDIPKWFVQIVAWKQELGAVGAYANLTPWTSLANQYLGIPSLTPRVLAILDCVTMAVLGGAERTEKALRFQDAEARIRGAMKDIVVDLSQNPVRRAYTTRTGNMKCMTTSSLLYTFERDSVVWPVEKMLLQGHSKELKFPDRMTDRELSDLAGMGMCLPSLGLIFVSIACVKMQ